MSLSATAKLHELRNKTNRQLASLISNRLDRGLALARSLEGDQSHHNWAAREQLHTFAEQALAQAQAWIPLLTESNYLERRRLENKLAQLRDALDRVAAPRMHAQAAC